MDTDHEFSVGDEFKCGEHIVTILSIESTPPGFDPEAGPDTPRDLIIGYSIDTPGMAVRTDARYADRLREALIEYGH